MSKKSPRPDLYAVPEECDCPACSGEELDPQDLLDDLVSSAADLLEAEDPLDVEMLGAMFVSLGALSEGFEEALIRGLIPDFEARATPEATVMLLAIGSMVPDQAAKAVSAAVDGLAIPMPDWAAELNEPVIVADCMRLVDPERTAAVLACSFHRAGRSHAILMTVDLLDCGAANLIAVIDTEHLPEMLAQIRADGLESTSEELDPAEFRWHVEAALDARAVHDDEAGEPGLDGLFDEEDDQPPYAAMATLLRARMSALPAPDKPKPPHGPRHDRLSGRTPVEVMARHLTGGEYRMLATELPPERKPADGPAPVYRLKVGLRGAKPPIWRRLEVPADMSLARLHAVIQVAFGWDDSHMHVFETVYGEFGIADSQLGHRPEAPVTLEQVVSGERDKIRYVYDFGDGWTHEILVEKVLDRDPAASYPRCTGGRRAAPPEDCGGVWGYEELLDVLANPADPEHADRLAWLGLDKAADFNPAAFDPDLITQTLSRLP